MLLSGRVDIALVFGYRDEAEPARLGVVELGIDPVTLITPGAGEYAAATAVAELRSAPWIAGCERCRVELLTLAAGEGFAPHVRCATDDYVAVQHLVAAGEAAAILPSLALAAYRHPGVRVVPVEGAIRQLRALTLGEAPHPPLIVATLACLTEAVGERLG